MTKKIKTPVKLTEGQVNEYARRFFARWPEIKKRYDKAAELVKGKTYEDGLKK